MKEKKDTSQITYGSNEAATVVNAVSLKGQLLIASPHINDSRFKHSVIMMCQHDQRSAMGIVINHQSQELNVGQLCKTLDMGRPQFHGDQPIHIGGPVEGSRGFVIHSQDYMLPESVALTHDISLTFSLNILRNITNGIGPAHSIISLGYAGWHTGQLEKEITANIWLNLPASSNLLFNVEVNNIWNEAYAKLGINPAHYSSGAGTA